MASNNQAADSKTRTLREVRQSLLRLHKALLENERETYERAHGRIETAYKFLDLLMRDPWFDWLHRLSELVVQMDELLDGEEPFTEDNVKGVIDQARVLLAPDENGTEFQRKYFSALQHSPEVVVTHGVAVKLLGTRQPS